MDIASTLTVLQDFSYPPLVHGAAVAKDLGRVVRKPVNSNPGLKVNWRSNFPSIKMLSTAYDNVLCSLRLFMLKTEGPKI